MLSTIRHGSTGDIVKIAQYLTKFAKRNEASGVYDAFFVSAMCTWQKNNGLEPDGIIGPKTWTKIVEKAPVCSISKNVKGPTACAVQILIGGVDVDGIFGKKTKEAVAAFQAANNLKTDGAVGFNTWTALITGIPKPETKFVQPKDYKQFDSKWGSVVYTSSGNKSQTIKNSGCGPTSMADIVATMKDPSITPPDLAKLAVKWGDRTKSDGTAWSFFKHIMVEFKFSKMIQTASLATLKACLDAGGYAICSMGPGYWTKGGHFICAWKYDKNYIYCNDPASYSRKKQKISQFEKERKQYFCFYK